MGGPGPKKSLFTVLSDVFLLSVQPKMTEYFKIFHFKLLLKFIAPSLTPKG